MLCPFCLAEVKFKLEPVDGRPVPVHLCPECGEMTPAMYVRDYRKYAPVVVNAIGFRGHGKTVYFATLFYALKRLHLAHHWQQFFTMALNEEALETVHEQMKMLQEGILPEATPKSFPRPTIIRVEGIPTQKNRTLLCYDTSGEAFEKATQLVQYAGFVRRAKTALFLVSIPDLEDVPTEMFKLLNTYIVGMRELGADTKKQHLLVVYTKADKMVARLTGEWRDLLTYLMAGSIDGLGDLEGYMKQLGRISSQLGEFTRKELLAHEFLNAVKVNFKSVEFAMTSALGAEPDEQGQLLVQIDPRRSLDPLLWMMQKSQATPLLEPLLWMIEKSQAISWWRLW